MSDALAFSSYIPCLQLGRSNSFYLKRIRPGNPAQRRFFGTHPLSQTLRFNMGNMPSVTISPGKDEDALKQELLAYYMADSAKFQRVVAQVEVAGRSTKPKFPGKLNVADVPRVPDTELEAFKKEHINMSKLSYSSPEAAIRMKRVRELQYDRWQWACNNMETYINMLRACGHSDVKIQAMLDGTPMCFESPEAYRKLRVALKKLSDDVEKEMGWTNVNFVITGSSVPGFSQNPIKGFADTPSKITSATKSDVDVCIVGDGIAKFMTDCLESGQPEPKRCFATTCSATTSATRFGCKDLGVICKAVDKFHREWTEILPGGLQLTFCEDDNSTPPWEARISIRDV